MLEMLWNIFFFSLCIGILVTVHEAGHFFVAKWCGVRILRFSIGFGTPLYTRKGKDGCEYSISAIPLGGYVSMHGEKDKVGETKQDGDSFKAKKVWQRFLIILAGPLCNIILALIIYTGINLHGVTIVKPVIGIVAQESIAAKAGLKAKDLIVSIENNETYTWQDFITNVIPYIKDSSVKVDVISDLGYGEKREISFNLSKLELKKDTDLMVFLGITPYYGKASTVLTTVVKDSAGFKAGLQVGDEIVKIDGVDVVNDWYLLKFYLDSSSKPHDILVKRDNKIYKTIISPELKYNEKTKKEKFVYGIGVQITASDEVATFKQYGLVEAFDKAIDKTCDMSLLIVNSLIKMIKGDISYENVGGPISIAKAAGDTANYGFLIFISFLATISVNLGIINLVPIPVLDGGQILFLAYEFVFKKEPSEKVQSFLVFIGIFLLLLIMMFAILNDVRSLF